MKISSDGSLPEITAEMLGCEVDKLGLSESKADALRIELMELYVAELKSAAEKIVMPSSSCTTR